MDKLELFQRTYEAIMDVSELPPYDCEDVPLCEEYMEKWEKEENLFRHIQGVDLEKEFIDFVMGKVHVEQESKWEKKGDNKWQASTKLTAKF